jgi:hypothetical protein
MTHKWIIHRPYVRQYRRGAWGGGSTFKARGLLYHSTLGLGDFYRTCIESNKEEKKQGARRRTLRGGLEASAPASASVTTCVSGAGLGLGV